MVSEGTPGQWPGTGLSHLSCVLNLAKSSVESELLDFVQRITTPDWLENQIRTIYSPALAGFLYYLRTRQSERVRAALINPTVLGQRLETTLANLERSADYTGDVRLVGAAALSSQLPDSGGQHKIPWDRLYFEQHGDSIAAGEVQLLAGVRALVERRPQTVPDSFVRTFAGRLQSAKPTTDQLAHVNESLLLWLTGTRE